ncbi:MAG TPA: hypothetical protein VMV21_11965, partial [Vicinamibacteria bacterium]|nr:hypothetical protein [Vicinamibacteria bacterium]
MSLMLLAWLASALPVAIESVALRPVGGSPGIVVVAHEALPPVVVSRDGERLRVRIPGARLSTRFAGPRLFALRTSAVHATKGETPSFDLRVRQAAGAVVLEMRVPTDVAFGVHQEGASLSFSFREADRGPSGGTSLLVAAHAPAGERAEAAAAPVAAPAAPTSATPAYAALRAADALTVSVESAGPRARVRIGGGLGLADARVRREGGEVIVTLDVGAEAVPASPAAKPPVDDVHVEKVASLAVIHVKVAPEVPFEVKREQRLLTLTFGEEALESLAPPPPPPVPTGVDVNTLVTPDIYKGLFPATAAPEADHSAAAASDLAREGLQVGRLHLRPSVLVSYVNGDYTLLDTPQPVTDRFLQLEPRVAADMPVLGGEFTADYALRLRFLSDFEEINSSSQLLNAGLQVPLGTRTTLRARDHFATGVLESTEVDPGQEYFFDLSRFHRNEVEVGARVETGSRIFVDGNLGYNDVRFDDPTSFFPYTESTARLGLGTTFGDNLRAGVYYSYFHVPPPDSRPVVESTANSVGVGMEGDFGALTRGDVRVDWRHETAPNAAPGGREYSGI